MRSKGYYSVIGLLVVGLMAVAIALGVLLEFGGTKQAYRQYEILFSDPVDGLNEQSPVKFNGVDVGYVSSISIDPQNLTKVKVVINIAQDVPIMTSTFARLTPQGITGLQYISLRLTQNSDQLIKPTKPGQLPIIPSQRSLFNNLVEQAGKIEADIHKVTKQLASLLSNENIQMINQTLANMNEASKQLNQQTMPALNAMIINMNTILPSLSDGANQLNRLMQQSQSLMQMLQRNPSVIIHGTTPLPAGPGESKS